jgi:glycosyltransferase involved in cell wall biosynthesis
MKRLRILTWHVHGNYLYYLTRLPHDFLLVRDPSRPQHHSGRSGTLPWGDNVHDLPVERIPHTGDIDVVIFQSRGEWELVQHEILTPAQRKLPRIYIEHDPPQEHPTDTRHWVDDPKVLLVHVTHFNRLMWDCGQTPTTVIEHGVQLLAPARWRGELERGVVVVNNLRSRGRRLGLDVWETVRARVPLVLYGMDSLAIGGEGEIENRRLPEAMAAYRFFFHPIRYTSLGLALIEAMMVGLPVVGLATTELPTVIQDGRNGFVATDVETLVWRMQALLADPGLARQLGEAGRATALERFGIDRFIADWQRALRRVTQ